MLIRYGKAACLVWLLIPLSISNGAQVNISGYDVNDAIISGFGNWTHSYTGTITGGSAFTHFSNPGTFATYSGGGVGTLNDGVISSSIVGTQLFLRPEANNVVGGATVDVDPNDNVPSNPAIFLTLDALISPQGYFVDQIDVYGGDIVDNAVPGLITELTVTLLDTNFNPHVETFATTPFGPSTSSIGTPVNDRITLAGSTLEGVPAFAVFITNINGDFDLASGFGPSITEIEIMGRAVPEPASCTMLMVALVVATIRRKRESV